MEKSDAQKTARGDRKKRANRERKNGARIVPRKAGRMVARMRFSGQNGDSNTALQRDCPPNTFCLDTWTGGP
jgi:hypothetical protein